MLLSWNLVLIMIEALGSTGTMPLPVEAALPLQFPIEVEVRPGTQVEPFAFAERFIVGPNEDVIKCKVTVISNSKGWAAPNKTQSLLGAALNPERHKSNQTISPRLFIVAHEIGHCFDNVKLPEDISAEGLKIWKEIYADAYASMVLKRTQKTSLFSFKKLAELRSFGYAEPYREFWNKAILEAADVDVTEKSDKDLLAIAREIRRNVWKSS